jgi:hypothetical protein
MQKRGHQLAIFLSHIGDLSWGPQDIECPALLIEPFQVEMSQAKHRG